MKRTSSVIVLTAQDATILDYYDDGHVQDEGPYSLAVARHLRPSAEVREVAGHERRRRYSAATEDMRDRAGGSYLMADAMLEVREAGND